MSYIVPLLRKMRGRLGMYLGTSSVIKLAAFLRGYDYAFTENSDRHVDLFLQQFTHWIHRRYQSTDLSWEEMILAHSRDEGDAIRQFWDLFDEFLREVPLDQATNGVPAAAADSSTPVTGSV